MPIDNVLKEAEQHCRDADRLRHDAEQMRQEAGNMPGGPYRDELFQLASQYDLDATHLEMRTFCRLVVRERKRPQSG